MKNKIGIKRLIYVLLLMLMLSLSLTACGDADKDDDDDRKSRKEKRVDDDDEDEDDDEKDDDEDEEESKEPETTPEPTPEPTLEPTPEPTPEPTEEPLVWENAYKNFFKEYGPVIKENVVILAESDFENIDIELGYVYNKKYIGMMLDVNGLYIEMYGDKNGLYAVIETELDDYTIYASNEVEDFNEYEYMFMSRQMLEFLNNIQYVEYIEEVVEYDATYDVVAGKVKDNGEWCEVECYINRETGEITSLDMIFENGDVFNVMFEYMDEADVNEEVRYQIEDYKDAGEEVSYDEFMDLYIEYLDEVSLNQSTGNKVEVENDEENWSQYYTNYFDEPIVFPEDYALEYTISMLNIPILMNVNTVDGITFAHYDFNGSIVDAYYDDETVLVGVHNGLSVDWAYAFLEDGEEPSDVITMIFWEDVEGATDDMDYVGYEGAEVIDGEVYDIVNIKYENDTQGIVYINRATQKIYKMDCSIEEAGIVIYFDKLEEIEIPITQDEAVEMTTDELADYFEKALEECLLSIYE